VSKLRQRPGQHQGDEHREQPPGHSEREHHALAVARLSQHLALVVLRLRADEPVGRGDGQLCLGPGVAHDLGGLVIGSGASGNALLLRVVEQRDAITLNGSAERIQVRRSQSNRVTRLVQQHEGTLGGSNDLLDRHPLSLDVSLQLDLGRVEQGAHAVDACGIGPGQQFPPEGGEQRACALQVLGGRIGRRIQPVFIDVGVHRHLRPVRE
jgi:hypothetical protein